MAATKNRQRALARAKLERQMARRAAAARRRRQRLAILGIVVAAIVVIGGATWIISANLPHGKKKTSAAPAKPAACKYTKSTQANPNTKDVGQPTPGKEPRSGTEQMTINTNLGEIDVQMDLAKAPCTAASFAYLAGKKFFDNTQCHRLVTSGIQVLQCGDPSATGSGGPTYSFPDENLPASGSAYSEGVVAMANSGPNTNGSQFFIIYGPSQLDTKYTIFGKVTKGIDLVKQVAKGGVTPSDPNSPNDGKPKTQVLFKTVTVGSPQSSDTVSSPPASPSAAS